MERGEIRWVAFKAPDKRRPVLILTRDRGVRVLSELTVAPLTTRVRGIRSEVVLTPADGLPETCAVTLDHVQTISRAVIGDRIARVNELKMRQVRDALLFALGFDD